MKPRTLILPAFVLGMFAAPATAQYGSTPQAQDQSQATDQQQNLPPGHRQPQPDPNAGVVPPPIPPSAATMAPAPPGVAQSADVVEVGGNVTPPPPPLDHYPFCSKTVTDHCMQRRDAPRGYGK